MRIALQWRHVLATIFVLAMVAVMLLPLALRPLPGDVIRPAAATSPWPAESHPAVIQQKFLGITPDRMILYTAPIGRRSG